MVHIIESTEVQSVDLHDILIRSYIYQSVILKSKDKFVCASLICYRVSNATIILPIQWINAVFLFAGGFKVPQSRLRWSSGPDLQAAPPQPHRSPLTTERHWPPVGALQLPPSPAPHLPSQEILIPPTCFLLPSHWWEFLICPSQQTLGRHASVSLPRASNCHYTGTF